MSLVIKLLKDLKPDVLKLIGLGVASLKLVT